MQITVVGTGYLASPMRRPSPGSRARPSRRGTRSVGATQALARRCLLHHACQLTAADDPDHWEARARQGTDTHGQ